MQVNKIKNIIAKHGRLASAFQTLHPQFTYAISQDQKAYIAYKSAHGRAIVAGQIIGPWEKIKQYHQEFRTSFQEKKLKLLYFGAEKKFLKKINLNSTYKNSYTSIGHEPLINIKNWQEKITHHSSLRALLNRAQNKKIEIQEISHIHSYRAQFENLLNNWLVNKRLPELHFLTELHVFDPDLERRYFIAKKENKLIAFATLCPQANSSNYLLEELIRSNLAPIGCNELLISEIIFKLKKEDKEYLNLGLCPLSQQLESKSNSFFIRNFFKVFRKLGNHYYNFDGIDYFKHKFKAEQLDQLYMISSTNQFNSKDLLALCEVFSHLSFGKLFKRVLNS